MVYNFDYLDPKSKTWAYHTEKIYRRAVKENDKVTIFKCFHRYCHAYVCKALVNLGFTTEEIQETALDATVYAMDRRDRKIYNGEMTYNKLGVWCWYAVKEFLYSKQRRFDDNMVFDSDVVEKYFEGDYYTGEYDE